MSEEKTKNWIFFFSLASLEGGFALFALLRVPTDPKNDFLFGLSLSRFVTAGALLGITLLAAWLGYRSWRNPIWREKYLLPENFPQKYRALHWASFFLALLFSLTLFLLRYQDPAYYEPLYLRAKPLLLGLSLIGFELSLWLLFLRYGFEAQKKYHENVLRLAGRIFILFLLLFAFIAVTRIGLTPDTAYWAEPGVPLQKWQFALALLLGFFALLYFTSHPLRRKKTTENIVIPLLLWGIALLLWWSVPMDVLKNSFYAPFAYPLGQSLPYSDAAFYDYLSQGLLLGNGFLTQVPPRPLYIVFLAGLRALFGINNYTGILLGQTFVLALFPVTLYFLGKNLHSRVAGITIAFLGMFREWTNLLVSSQTRVSNSRMTLTDLPTALVLSLLALVVLLWLKKRDAAPARPLLAGGLFGTLLLLRTQTMLLLPFILLLALLVYFPERKRWLQLSLVFLLGMTLSIAPWLTRNARLTGKFTFDDPKQLSVLASQYRKSDNLSLDFDYENESVSNSIVDFALENPVYVANFIATHFFATEINGLLALPLIEPFNGFRQPINIYWTSWDGHLSPANRALLIFYLAVIALGIAAAWKKTQWVGLTPLFFNLAYALSNGIARFSGWRYDFPADWVAYFYFGIGFVELIGFFAAGFHLELGGQAADETGTSHRAKNPFILIAISLFFLALGFSPLLMEEKISASFSPLSETELLAHIPQDAAQFVRLPDTEVLSGRLLYPRFYARKDGIASAHPWAAYLKRDFARMGFLLINSEAVQVVFPVEKMPAEFPNGVDVTLLGCPKENYFEARLIYIGDEDLTLISARGLTPCEE
jgi:hypothetical protein